MATPNYPSFLTRAEVAALTGQSVGHSGNIIKALNEELKKDNFLVFPGRVSTEYYCKRVGINPETIPASLENPKKRGGKKKDD